MISFARSLFCNPGVFPFGFPIAAMHVLTISALSDNYMYLLIDEKTKVEDLMFLLIVNS